MRRSGRKGQSLMEYSVLVAAVTAALVMLSQYVRFAFTGQTNQIEDELSGRPNP